MKMESEAIQKSSRENYNMRVPELLVPASSLEVLKIAVVFGADAVYIGGEAFGLRAKAKIFLWKRCVRAWNLPMRVE